MELLSMILPCHPQHQSMGPWVRVPCSCLAAMWHMGSPFDEWWINRLLLIAMHHDLEMRFFWMSWSISYYDAYYRNNCNKCVRSSICTSTCKLQYYSPHSYCVSICCAGQVTHLPQCLPCQVASHQRGMPHLQTSGPAYAGSRTWLRAQMTLDWRKMRCVWWHSLHPRLELPWRRF